MRYNVLRPYLDKRKGTVSGGYQIFRRKVYWGIAIADFLRSQSIIETLPPRHAEKIARKPLALKLRKGTKWMLVRPKVERFRRRIRNERDRYIESAARGMHSKLSYGDL